MAEKTKYANLDGLRGIAAFIVVLWHYSQTFLPSLNGWSSVHTIPLQTLIATTPLHLLLGGQFSVSVFFVLSGFVLSLSYFASGSRSVLVSASARRYFRLMLPVLGSVLLAALLLKIGLMHHLPPEQATGGPLWLAQYWNYPASFVQATYQGTIGVFTDTGNGYNPVLWTMRLELFGSFLVFAFLALFGRWHWRWIVYLGIAALSLKSFYFAFLSGVAIADMWTNRVSVKQYFKPLVSTILLAGGLLLGGFYISSLDSLYRHLQLPGFTQNELATFLHSVGATAVVLAVLTLPWLSRFFETRPLQFLGRVSFSLYLLHFIILGSIGTLVFSTLLHYMPYGLSFGIMFIVSLGLTLALSALYTRYVDGPAIIASKRISNLLITTVGTYRRWLTSSQLSQNNHAPKPIEYTEPRPVRSIYPAAD